MWHFIWVISSGSALYAKVPFRGFWSIKSWHDDFVHSLTLYLIETPFNTFTNRVDPDQAALVRAAWSGSTLFAYGNMIRHDPTRAAWSGSTLFAYGNMIRHDPTRAAWSGSTLFAYGSMIRHDPTRAAWSGSTLFAYGNMIRYDPTQADLTSNFIVLWTNVKVYLYNYS